MNNQNTAETEGKSQEALLMQSQRQSEASASRLEDIPTPSTTVKLTPEEIQRMMRVTAALVDEERTTLVLKPDQRNSIPQGNDLYGYKGEATSYLPLPKSAADSLLVLMSIRIELHPLLTREAPIGVELLGDVVLGINKSDDQQPDLDLSDYGGYSQGVSRRHAMLRPTAHRLYLIDLQSTNGTMHNALQMASGSCRELRDGDIITLGSLSFVVRMVGSGGHSL